MKIEQMHFDDNQCSRACYNLYITEHPHPSWKEIAFALYLGGHFDEMEIVQKKYLKGKQELKLQCQLYRIYHSDAH